MVELINVSKIYNPGKTNQVNALNGISINIDKGEFVVIVGANGSGKSTLLDLVAGSVFPDSGDILVDNVNVTSFAEYKRSKWIARIFQNPLSGTASELSIIDNFRLAALRTQPKGLFIGINETFKNQVREKISTLSMGLENKIEQPMGTLSGGQRQALTLLMGVMDSCKVLLLDEPTAALDPRSAEVVMRTAAELIRDYKLTAILVTHNLKEAFNYGTRIIRMEEGTIKNDLPGAEKAGLNQNDLFDWFR